MNTPKPPALLSPEQLEEIAKHPRLLSAESQFDVSMLLEHIEALNLEVDVLRRYGNKDCLNQADEALAIKRETGVGPWEDIRIASFTPNQS